MVLFKKIKLLLIFESANIQLFFEMKKFFTCFFFSGRTETSGTSGSASRTGNYETGGTGEAGGTSGKAGKQDIFLVFGR